MLPNPYVLLAAAGFWLVSVGGAYLKGYSDADNRAQVAELQGALNAAYEDLNAQRVAAEFQRVAAEANRMAAETAEEQADAYEAELQARGPDAACRISDDDRRWLQQNHYSPKNPPPR